MNPPSNFDIFFDRLMSNEGGYTEGKGDPGGETNWGITWPVLREAVTLKLVPPLTTIATLTRELSKTIYRVLFWERGKMEQFDPAIGYQALDFAVNSGIHTAFTKLQAAVGVSDDGFIGPLTVAAIKAMDVPDVLMRYTAQRLRYWTRRSNWPVAGKGWINRAADNLEYAAKDTP